MHPSSSPAPQKFEIPDLMDLAKYPLSERPAPGELNIELHSAAGRAARWDRFYSAGVGLKEFFIDAYYSALRAPLLAGCELSGRDEVRMLIVGAGDGFFARNVQGRLEKDLRELMPEKHLSVVETDVVGEVLKRSPAQRKVVCSFEDLLPTFLGEQFDIVLGESMLHQALSPRRVESSIKQLKGLSFLMSDRSIFLHIQDNVPDPSGLFSREELAARGIPELGWGAVGFGDRGAAQAMHEFALEVQQRQLHFHRQLAKAANLGILAAQMDGTSERLLSEVPEAMRKSLISENLNVLALQNGMAGRGKNGEFSRTDAVQMKWSGLLTAMCPTFKMDTVVAALEKFE